MKRTEGKILWQIHAKGYGYKGDTMAFFLPAMKLHVWVVINTSYYKYWKLTDCVSRSVFTKLQCARLPIEDQWSKITLKIIKPVVFAFVRELNEAKGSNSFADNSTLLKRG